MGFSVFVINFLQVVIGVDERNKKDIYCECYNFS